MNKRTQKKRLERAANNPFGGIRMGNSGTPGNMYVIPESVIKQVIANFAPQKNKSEMYSPGAPIRPIPEITPAAGPRTWNYPTSINVNGPDRTLGNRGYDIPSFQQLRMFSKMYSGCTLCERVVLDLIPLLELDIVPIPGLLDDGENARKYQKDITPYIKWFEKPDRIHDTHSWLRMAYREQTQIDELYVYKKPNRGGGLYALQIIAGDTMKPLQDEQGIMPMPPFPAFQQFPYGAPGGLYTSDQFIHYQETPAADDPYGFSRVERIILNVNIALRKQNKDLNRYTEGNIPAGIMEVPEALNWTPDQIDAYEQSWNALMAGNLQQATRIKFTQPGMKYTPFDQPEAQLHLTEFDMFLLNLTTASYGLSMQDLAFTGDIHKSSGDSQQNVMYRRSLYPFIKVYERIFTDVLHNNFNEPRFMVVLKGFEEAEDIGAKATAYSTLTGAGILGLSDAAKLMNLPEDKNAAHIGRMIITKNGPIFLDDIASDKVREAAVQAQLSGYALAANAPTDGPEEEDEEDEEAPPPAQQQDDNPEKPGAQDQGKPTPKDQETQQRILDVLERAEAMLRLAYERSAPAPTLLSRQGSCQCEVCTERNGQPVSTVQPPYHDGCDCTVEPEGDDHVERTRTEAEAAPGDRPGDTSDPGRAARADAALAASHRADQPGGTGPDKAVSSEYRRWRARALEDVKAGKVQRGFTTTLIPEGIHRFISQELARCSTPDEVRSVFERARENSFIEEGAI